MFNISIFGGSELGKRPWSPGKKLWLISILGGDGVDFQQAQLVEGVTKVLCISLLGGTDITVPAELPVTISGLSVFGGQEVEPAAPPAGTALSGKSLHVTDISIFGGVTVKLPK